MEKLLQDDEEKLKYETRDTLETRAGKELRGDVVKAPAQDSKVKISTSENPEVQDEEWVALDSDEEELDEAVVRDELFVA